ncbi:MAG: right-handed parallel beta-helix repeat-containing protein [Parcubacteria group bacterium]|jgi:hypothetical protein
MQKKILIIIVCGAIAFCFFVVVSKFGNPIVIYNSFRGEKSFLHVSGTMYYVSPNGDDSYDGRTQQTPFLSIQKAVSFLMPGDGLTLLDGQYIQDFSTIRNGTENDKIIITGSKNAIVKGTGKKSRIIEINHDHIVLHGFVVDGLLGDVGEGKNYRDKLIYVEGKEELNGVTGVQIMNMDLKNAGGECLRIKYFSQRNEIAHNKIMGCGAYDFLFDGGGKNGEGIYIGTAPEQVEKDKNITRDIDQSNHNWIHDNTINTQGNECVDIKEGASFNVVENNICTGQKDDESAGLDSRGNSNIFRGNEVYGCMGAGIRLGGDKNDDGINNDVIKNNLHDNKGGGIKIQAKPQGKICGNQFSNNGKNELVGEYEKDVKNEKKCN